MDITTEILTKALQALEAHGWNQGGFFSDDGEGRMCAAGAIMFANNHFMDYESLKALAEALPTCSSHSNNYPLPRVAFYNDGPDTTYEDIALAFKKAINREKS